MKLVSLCDSRQPKASIVEPGVGSRKGLQCSEAVLVKEKRYEVSWERFSGRYVFLVLVSNLLSIIKVADVMIYIIP